jgi:hypothetical protein
MIWDHTSTRMALDVTVPRDNISAGVIWDTVTANDISATKNLGGVHEEHIWDIGVL